MGIEGERWYTVAEVAALMRINGRTVTRAIQAGSLRAIKMGDRAGWRVSEHDLQAWLDSRANKPRKGASNHDER